MAIRDMRHIINGERRSHASKVSTGSFVPWTSNRDAVRTEGGNIGAPSRRIEELAARNIGSLDPKFGSFCPGQAMEILAMTYDCISSVTVLPMLRAAGPISPHSTGLTRSLPGGAQAGVPGLGSSSLWNHFGECPVSPWGRWRNHRHEDRISCCNCDSCRCRWYWTGGPFCRLATARKAVHACCRPIGDPVS